ncbi:Uncharacterized protein HZ326_15965 [Fusarium oxysporum f. sp. albedinis]|nr:Uncharacterized protein HZ326_15965 [Fusarium oxysporum f. sp. albedinis]
MDESEADLPYLLYMRYMRHSKARGLILRLIYYSRKSLSSTICNNLEPGLHDRRAGVETGNLERGVGEPGLLRDLSDWLLRRTRHATRIPLRMVMDRESRGWLLLFVVLLFLCDNLVKYL